MRKRREKIVLTEEQEQFFIKTWENHSVVESRHILQQELDLTYDECTQISKRLRDVGKLRNRAACRYGIEEIQQMKAEYELGYTLKDIAHILRKF